MEERLNINDERARLLRRCYELREAIEQLRLRDDRDAPNQDLEGSSCTPADLNQLRGRDLTTLDHTV